MKQQQGQTVDANLQFLEQYNLGSFRKMYQGSGWGCLVVFVVFMAIWVSFVFVGFVQVWEHVPKDAGAVVGIIAGFGFMMLVGIGLLVLFLIGIYNNITRGKLNAYLYEYGFIYCTSKGIVQQVVRWTDITVFQHKVVERSSRNSEGRTSTSYSDVYTITLRNTEKPIRLSFGKEFAKTVEWEVANWQYPYARAAYQSGNAVRFGHLDMWPQGLYDTVKGTTLPWSEVESIKVNGYGTVHIKRSGARRDWANFPIGELNNPEVLRRLIETEVPYRFEFLLAR